MKREGVERGSKKREGKRKWEERTGNSTEKEGKEGEESRESKTGP